LIGSVYYLKVLKVCYVDNPTSWATPAYISSMTAYIVAVTRAILLIGLWHGNYLFLMTHLMALKVSISIFLQYSIIFKKLLLYLLPFFTITIIIMFDFRTLYVQHPYFTKLNTICK